MLKKKVTIVNKLGLHARAAAKFVNHAGHFASEIEVSKNGHKVNGKSIMGIMMLAATKGAELELIVDGEDEQAMMDDIVNLINNRFGEDE
jgi:phosphocarrier protein HPr